MTEQRPPVFPPVKTTEGDKFRVDGYPTLYDDVLDAIEAARKTRKSGITVRRMSDGALVATIPGYVPPPPRVF